MSWCRRHECPSTVCDGPHLDVPAVPDDPEVDLSPELQVQFDALLKRVEEAELDSKRLDKLERSHYTLYRQRDFECGDLNNYHVAVDEDKQPRIGILKTTVREAIDALPETPQEG